MSTGFNDLRSAIRRYVNSRGNGQSVMPPPASNPAIRPQSDYYPDSTLRPSLVTAAAKAGEGAPKLAPLRYVPETVPAASPTGLQQLGSDVAETARKRGALGLALTPFERAGEVAGSAAAGVEGAARGAMSLVRRGAERAVLGEEGAKRINAPVRRLVPASVAASPQRAEPPQYEPETPAVAQTMPPALKPPAVSPSSEVPAYAGKVRGALSPDDQVNQDLIDAGRPDLVRGRILVPATANIGPGAGYEGPRQPALQTAAERALQIENAQANLREQAKKPLPDAIDARKIAAATGEDYAAKRGRLSALAAEDAGRSGRKGAVDDEFKRNVRLYGREGALKIKETQMAGEEKGKDRDLAVAEADKQRKWQGEVERLKGDLTREGFAADKVKTIIEALGKVEAADREGKSMADRLIFSEMSTNQRAALDAAVKERTEMTKPDGRYSQLVAIRDAAMKKGAKKAAINQWTPDAEKELATLEAKMKELDRTLTSQFLKPSEGQAAQPSSLPMVDTQEEANALPSGTVYIGPDGKKRKRV